MSKAKARVFVPLTKVDEEQRLVYGRITQELLDKANEVMDYESSKPLFEKWSNEIHENSGGLSKGNVRVMHGLTAAGKLTELEFNDAEKAIDVCAKIVDDKEWEKVTEGVYTGFSVGGKYAKKWTDTVDGQKVKKFTAEPNEVSIVDNPCVPSACFSMFKADGTEEQVEFKVENDDEAWPDFAKAADPEETDTGGEAPEGEAAVVEKQTPAEASKEPNAETVATKAAELAKAANDGTTWADHIEAARAELMKGDSATSVALEQERETKENADESGTPKAKPEGKAAEGSEDEEAGDDESGTPAEKVTPPGVKQVWEASDGKTFEKKEDCVAHEDELAKAAEPQTEAEKLKARLVKATAPDEPVDETPVIEDFDRLGKALNALSTPFGEDGQPKLEKGMYTINRFSNVLSDMAALSRSIKAEGQKEGDEESDATISADIIAAVKTLGASFITYATEQVQELLAGMDDDVVVGYYDYYYNAAKADPENEMAKDVVSLITDHREPSREKREQMSKAFGIVEDDTDADEELSPPMQKRFDALEAENAELKKVAEEAVETVEKLTKRVETIENTPMPRAPRNVVLRDGDGNFLGKKADTPEEKLEVLHDMLKTEGPDAIALKLIKLSQANPIHLNLKG